MEYETTIFPYDWSIEEPYNVSFQSEWFANTNPKFNNENYRDYLPEWWKDDDGEIHDVEWIAFHEFIGFNFEILLENNQEILNSQALAALLELTKYREDEIYVPPSYYPSNTGLYTEDCELIFHRHIGVFGTTILTNFYFEIFNQNQEKVFETKARKIEWRARINNVLQYGKFTWNMQGTLPDGENISMSGELNVIEEDL